jgi:diphosphomevalonate decarboxylase
VAAKHATARDATYEAAPNIALVKYWGVRDTALALPYNSSLSVTLDRLRTRTRVRFDPSRRADSLELNGRPAAPGALRSVAEFLGRVRTLAGIATYARVESSNNFPTASGLASSASGFAALAGAASAAAGLDLSRRELSRLARFGSGSASRSLFGGFVEWRAGVRPDGSDCFAVPLYGEDYWPQLRDLVVLIEDAPEKSVRSAVAMQQSVATSPKFAERQRALPTRILRIRAALRERDAARLFPLIMEECDDFRAVCESTVPSLDYLTATSRRVLDEVRAINAEAHRPLVGYTHDAGAHLHLFLEAPDAAKVRRRLARIPGIRSLQLLRPGPGGRRLRRATV